MQTSIWEKQSFYAPKDVIIIGSGFTGLWSAWHLKRKHPKLSVAILEKGIIPTGASTRNAGFACFGSVTELLEDAEKMNTAKMVELVAMRYKGLKKIQKVFVPSTIDFTLQGGYELITAGKDTIEKDKLHTQSTWINQLIEPVTGSRTTFRLADKKIEKFGFENVSHLIENKLEGSLHPGKLCQQLLQLVQSLGVTVLTSVNVKSIERTGSLISLHTSNTPELKASKVLVCTNAFASELLPELDVVPARGQVLLTSEVPGLAFKGTFHYDGGYYYFRNLGNRVLLGGARNTAFNQEQTTEMQVTANIQDELERFLSHHLLRDKEYRITDRWSGIMGMGPEKLPVIKEVSQGVFCAVRMNGMGVALAPVAGEIAAKLMGFE
ncbi:MAG: FAD-binding oxidoreductase [Chitinophagaceae bacterium]|nr:FAD-binding oxidoreductase [Chitinophagaceae bacterium]